MCIHYTINDTDCRCDSFQLPVYEQNLMVTPVQKPISKSFLIHISWHSTFLKKACCCKKLSYINLSYCLAFRSCKMKFTLILSFLFLLE